MLGTILDCSFLALLGPGSTVDDTVGYQGEYLRIPALEEGRDLNITN